MLIDLLKKRFGDYLASGCNPYQKAGIEPIKTALDNHKYQADVANPLDMLYLRKKIAEYKQQIVDGIDSPIWPAIKVRILFIASQLIKYN